MIHNVLYGVALLKMLPLCYPFATPLLPLEVIHNISQIILHYYLRWEELRVYRLVSGVLVRVKSEFTLTKVRL